MKKVVVKATYNLENLIPSESNLQATFDIHHTLFNRLGECFTSKHNPRANAPNITCTWFNKGYSRAKLDLCKALMKGEIPGIKACRDHYKQIQHKAQIDWELRLWEDLYDASEKKDSKRFW